VGLSRRHYLSWQRKGPIGCSIDMVWPVAMAAGLAWHCNLPERNHHHSSRGANAPRVCVQHRASHDGSPPLDWGQRGLLIAAYQRNFAPFFPSPRPMSDCLLLIVWRKLLFMRDESGSSCGQPTFGSARQALIAAMPSWIDCAVRRP